MDSRIGFYIFIAIITVGLQIVMRFVRGRFAKPRVDQKDGLQKPGGFDRALLVLFTALTSFAIFFTVIGLFMRETEMALVFGVLSVIFFLLRYFVHREYNMTYQENEDYFVFMKKDKEYKVHYDNIVDWSPSYNEILVLDGTQNDGEFVPVNITVFQTDTLMRKLLEKSAAGEFSSNGPIDHHEELIHYLNTNHYGHVVDAFPKCL